VGNGEMMRRRIKGDAERRVVTKDGDDTAPPPRRQE